MCPDVEPPEESSVGHPQQGQAHEGEHPEAVRKARLDIPCRDLAAAAEAVASRTWELTQYIVDIIEQIFIPLVEVR